MQAQRQKKCNTHVTAKPIDVDTYKCKKPAEVCQDWIPELGLLKSDQETLLNPVGWLTDSIVDAAQTLLKDSCSVPGFESVACGLTMTFPVQPGEFVQILNTGRGHWVTVSTVGVPHPVVRVYDSIYSSAGTSLEAQVSSLIYTREESIYLEFADVPIQAGKIALVYHYTSRTSVSILDLLFT